MIRSLVPVTAIAACLLIVGLAPAAPSRHQVQREEACRIEGAVDRPGDWTRTRLTNEFAADIKSVSYTLKGGKSQAHCIPLLTLVQAAKPRLNPKAKNHQLAFAVMVRADDGYTVCFSMGELSPRIGKRAVWLALDRDGKPLPESDGPLQLLSTDDEKPARWVRSVVSITLVDGLQSGPSKPVNGAK